MSANTAEISQGFWPGEWRRHGRHRRPLYKFPEFREDREARGLSVEQIAARTQMSVAAIRGIEAGQPCTDRVAERLQATFQGYMSVPVDTVAALLGLPIETVLELGTHQREQGIGVIPTPNAESGATKTQGT